MLLINLATSSNAMTAPLLLPKNKQKFHHMPLGQLRHLELVE